MTYGQTSSTPWSFEGNIYLSDKTITVLTKQLCQKVHYLTLQKFFTNLWRYVKFPKILMSWLAADMNTLLFYRVNPKIPTHRFWLRNPKVMLNLPVVVLPTKQTPGPRVSGIMVEDNEKINLFVKNCRSRSVISTVLLYCYWCVVQTGITEEMTALKSKGLHVSGQCPIKVKKKWLMQCCDVLWFLVAQFVWGKANSMQKSWPVEGWQGKVIEGIPKGE